MNSYHAFASDGEIARDRRPEFYTGLGKSKRRAPILDASLFPLAPEGGRGEKCRILLRRSGPEGEGVDGASQFLGQDLVDQALALDAAEAGEASGDDLDVEMGLALGPRPGMAGMALRNRRSPRAGAAPAPR